MVHFHFLTITEFLVLRIWVNEKLFARFLDNLLSITLIKSFAWKGCCSMKVKTT